jgi:hypothetical protein
MKIVLMIVLQSAAMAAAFEPGDIRGLPLKIEGIPEAVVVDGLAMRVARAEGAGVTQVAQRMLQRWQSEGSEVSSQQAQGWQIASRLQRNSHEVIQWRGSGNAAQLLHSTFVTSQLPLKAAAPPFPLPVQCSWGRVIEGVAGPTRYEQHVARCQASSTAVTAALRLRLLAEGWAIRGQAQTGWELDLAGTQGRLTVAGAPGTGESSLVWISFRQRTGAGP